VQDEGSRIKCHQEKQIVPVYYDKDEFGISKGWVKIMKESIKSAAPRFSSRRMVKEYALSFYQDALRHAHENVPQTPESPKSMKPISPKR